jgi:hypothetical protein
MAGNCTKLRDDFDAGKAIHFISHERQHRSLDRVFLEINCTEKLKLLISDIGSGTVVPMLN